MIKCDKCGKGVGERPLYRANPKGEKGIFRHEKCGGIPEDQETKEISEIIHNG